MSEINQ